MLCLQRELDPDSEAFTKTRVPASIIWTRSYRRHALSFQTLAMSRPSSPSASTGGAAPQKSLLQSIIENISTKRARSIPEKQVVILGEPQTGKTTLISSIIQRSSASEGSDFVIGYEWCNVTDEGDDGEFIPSRRFCTNAMTFIVRYCPDAFVYLHNALLA